MHPKHAVSAYPVYDDGFPDLRIIEKSNFQYALYQSQYFERDSECFDTENHPINKVILQTV